MEAKKYLLKRRKIWSIGAHNGSSYLCVGINGQDIWHKKGEFIIKNAKIHVITKKELREINKRLDKSKYYYEIEEYQWTTRING